MISSHWNFLFKAHTHQTTLKQARTQFWQPRGVLESWNGHEEENEGNVFIGECCHQLSKKSTDVQYYLFSGPNGALYVQVLSNEYFKK
jgi:hypothetical protein